MHMWMFIVLTWIAICGFYYYSSWSPHASRRQSRTVAEFNALYDGRRKDRADAEVHLMVAEAKGHCEAAESACLRAETATDPVARHAAAEDAVKEAETADIAIAAASAAARAFDSKITVPEAADLLARAKAALLRAAANLSDSVSITSAPAAGGNSEGSQPSD